MPKAKKRRPAIRFKGWDWTELLELEKQADTWPKLPKDFKCDPEYIFEEDAKAAYLIRKYLNDMVDRCWDDIDPEAKRTAKYVRKFCAALGRTHDNSAPVYTGMALIEHDMTLFHWVLGNLESMWT